MSTGCGSDHNLRYGQPSVRVDDGTNNMHAFQSLFPMGQVQWP